jgi:acetyl esterase
MDSGSMKQFKRAPVWNAAQNRQMWKWYLPKRDAAHIEYASPLEAPAFAGLPPAYIEVAQLDPLRDQGEAFADALQDAGVLARLVRVTGAVHGFDLMKNSGLVSECIKLRALALRNAFYGDGKENSSENEANVPVGHL